MPCWCKCCIMRPVFSMAPLHLLGQHNGNEMQHDLFGQDNAIGTSISMMLCQRFHQWHHSICLVMIIKNEVQHDSSGHLMHLVLALVSCYTDGIVNGINAFIRSKWSYLGAMWPFGHVMPLTKCWHQITSVALKWHHCIPYVKTIKMRYNLTFWPYDTIGTGVSAHDTDGIINSTTALFKSKQLKWGAMWHYLSCNAISTSIILCWWHHQWHHCIP